VCLYVPADLPALLTLPLLSPGWCFFLELLYFPLYYCGFLGVCGPMIVLGRGVMLSSFSAPQHNIASLSPLPSLLFQPFLLADFQLIALCLWTLPPGFSIVRLHF
jgi:hypothetical protein